MEAKITRTDEKIRRQFIVYARPPGGVLHLVGEGHQYEQLNCMLTKRDGHDCSEQHSSLDAMLQSFDDVYQIVFP